MAHPTDPISLVLFWVTVIFSFGMLGRYLAHRFGQPGVLGELLMGILVGNICYYFCVPEIVILREGATIFNVVSHLIDGVSLPKALELTVSNPASAAMIENALHSSAGVGGIKVAYALDIFSRYGVIFLLFMVGLESSFEEIRQTGRPSLRVAILGVIAPLLLGFLLMSWLLPEASFSAHLFVGATLTATSVGITARVLKEMHKINTVEAKTILGAAMIDDVLGLMLLAVVSSLVTHGHIEGLVLLQVVLMTLLFFALVLYLGPKFVHLLVKFFSFLPPWETKLLVAFIFSMFLSWLATLVQLASIIGAFSAGLVLHDAFFGEKCSGKNLSIKDVMAPLELLLAPLFFMLIGIQVKLETFLDVNVLWMAFGLIIVAILGKLLSGLGARHDSDKLLVGIGMLPRGEVGLVFASLGRASGVISDALFSAIILMVVITTLIAPVWLKSRFTKKGIK